LRLVSQYVQRLHESATETGSEFACFDVCSWRDEMDNTNRAWIIGAVVVVAATIGYFLLAPSDSTPPRSTTSEATQPAQPKTN
jgi:hypothetical protein